MTLAIEDMGFEQWKINDLLSEIWLFKSKSDTSKGAVFSYLNSGFGGCISRPLQILNHLWPLKRLCQIINITENVTIF